MMTMTILPAIGAMGTGAGLMYMLDPKERPRRRALVRKKFVHWGHGIEDMTGCEANYMKRYGARHVG